VSALPRLRPTMLSDLDWVVGVEQDGANRPFITPWERMQHEGALRFADARCFIVEGQGQARLGFEILQGCRSPDEPIELKRLALQPACLMTCCVPQSRLAAGSSLRRVYRGWAL
jgi:diamine N-acetyltransferase